jgi:hypothetical protein
MQVRDMLSETMGECVNATQFENDTIFQWALVIVEISLAIRMQNMKITNDQYRFVFTIAITIERSGTMIKNWVVPVSYLCVEECHVVLWCC